MSLKWNKVTWYSRILSLVVFLFIVPVIAFNIGVEYAHTEQAIVDSVLASR